MEFALLQVVVVPGSSRIWNLQYLVLVLYYPTNTIVALNNGAAFLSIKPVQLYQYPSPTVGVIFQQAVSITYYPLQVQVRNYCTGVLYLFRVR
jgi:hypothetical protein